ncbi:MAG: hypothetical protein NVSMB32_11140 [Actinomycetota bacterium]
MLWIAAALAVLFALPILVVAIIGDEFSPAAPSPAALADIPSAMLVLYQSGAAACPGLDWTVLAGIGKIESNHGRDNSAGVHSGANYAGAEGPMQFLAATWAAYGDGVALDVYDPAAAIPGAARYLCASGAPGNLHDAIFAYNHAEWYVKDVLTQAAAYAAAAAAAPAGVIPVGTTGQQLLADPNVILPPDAQKDIMSGVIDQRVIDFLHWAGQHHTIVISVLKTGHTQYVEGTNRVSNHFVGRAADIDVIDGVAVSPGNTVARAFAMDVAALASGGPHEVGTPWADLGYPGYFSDAHHQNHLHLGWSA